jgi:hypothetical protein
VTLAAPKPAGATVDQDDGFDAQVEDIQGRLEHARVGVDAHDGYLRHAFGTQMLVQLLRQAGFAELGERSA